MRMKIQSWLQYAGHKSKVEGRQSVGQVKFAARRGTVDFQRPQKTSALCETVALSSSSGRTRHLRYFLKSEDLPRYSLFQFSEEFLFALLTELNKTVEIMRNDVFFAIFTAQIVSWSVFNMAHLRTDVDGSRSIDKVWPGFRIAVKNYSFPCKEIKNASY